MKMTSSSLTDADLDVLAQRVHQARHDWHLAGIVKVLHQLRPQHAGERLMAAAMAAAANPAFRTPAAIGFDGPHWPPIAPDPAAVRPLFYRPDVCATCGQTRRRCERPRPLTRRLEDLDDHAFESATSLELTRVTRRPA